MNPRRARYKLKPLDILYGIALIGADLFIYFVLSLFFSGYEDFYTESKGAYMSLNSMTAIEKVVYFAIILWYVANAVAIIWVGYKIYKWFKNSARERNTD
jgi:hypothetical protein